MAALILLFSGCRSKNNDAGMDEDKCDEITNVASGYELDKVFFVGMIGQKPGLYEYDFVSKTFSEFWKNDKEEVVEFSYSPNKRFAFMITASQLGKKGVFPFINDVKLYKIDLESSKVILIENIGSGLQVYSAWINDSSFHVYFHILDITAAKYVEQKIIVYNSAGQKLSGVNKNFYLDKQGFPSFPSDRKQMVSPNEKYSLLSIDSALTQILITDKNKDRKTTVIARVDQKLSNVAWSNDGSYLFFTTNDISPNNETIYDPEPNTSKLFIFSISGYKMQKIFEGGGIKNFMLNQNYLLFDDGFKEKSRVYIYNINTNAISDSIIIRGGCGLKNIPLIPNYEA